MNSTQMTITLIRDRWHRSLVMPRITPPNWWECDLLEISAAGYSTEYEIKTTIADFRQDKHKSKREWPNGYFRGTPSVLVTKHDKLSAKSTDGPNRFYFVVPYGITHVAEAETPLWAGLLALENVKDKYLRIHRVKPAPRLHNQRVKPRTKAAIYVAAYFRFHRNHGTTKRWEEILADATTTFERESE